MLKQGFDLRLGQTLSMTPQLQQAIRLLQLSSLELQEEIQQALEENPLLQLSEEAEDKDASNAPQAGEEPGALSEDVSSTADTPQLDSEIPDELGHDAEWEDTYDTHSSNSDSNGDKDGFLENQQRADSGLQEHLLWQINMSNLSDTDKYIASLLIGLILVLLGEFIGRGLFTRQLLALAAASVFPVLSMNVIFNIWDKNTSDKHSLLAICWNGIWQLALAIALSLVGAAFLSAILTDSRFLLEIDIYRGVKLTFILPVMLTAVLFMKRYDLLQVVGKGLKTLWERLNGLLDTGITFRHVAVLAVLLFIAYYFDL